MTNLATIEAYSRLKSLKEHLPARDVDQKYLGEFAQILDQLEKASGVSLANFGIPPTAIGPVITGGNYETGETHYSSEHYADHEFVLMKVDAVLTMFFLHQASASADGSVIGFVPPR